MKLNIPPAGRDILKRAFLTIVHSLAAVGIALAAGVPLKSQSGVIIAGLGGAVSILWHGLPAIVGTAKAKRLTKQLTAVGVLEAQIRAQIVAESTAPVVGTPAVLPGATLTP